MNLLGGAIIGYNSGIVSGMSHPFIACTLFEDASTINVSLLQGFFTASILVGAAIGSPLGVAIQKKWGMKLVRDPIHSDPIGTLCHGSVALVFLTS